MSESMLPVFILFETISSTLVFWFPQAQAAFLVTGCPNSCTNLMDCLYALSFSEVPLRVMGVFVCNAGSADHRCIGPGVWRSRQKTEQDE